MRNSSYLIIGLPSEKNNPICNSNQIVLPNACCVNKIAAEVNIRIRKDPKLNEFIAPCKS